MPPATPMAGAIISLTLQTTGGRRGQSWEGTCANHRPHRLSRGGSCHFSTYLGKQSAGLRKEKPRFSAPCDRSRVRKRVAAAHPACHGGDAPAPRPGQRSGPRRTGFVGVAFVTFPRPRRSFPTILCPSVRLCVCRCILRNHSKGKRNLVPRKDRKSKFKIKTGYT